MADREVRKYSRRELLELVIRQERENEELRAQLEQCRQELDNRAIIISNAGTMAEAALRLNRVFEAADAAVRQYLENIRIANQQPVSANKPAEAETEAKRAENVRRSDHSLRR